jgi:mRNA interferase RelE/StbE
LIYRIEFSETAKKDLKKISSESRRRIFKWLDKNIKDCENPRSFGKALSGDKSGLWRYRVGNYRIVVEIFDDRLLIDALHIAHRSQVYDIF